MRKFHLCGLALATASMLAGAQAGLAQNPAATPRAQRLEARQERLEQRQAMRMGERAPYYSQQTWTQLDPWISRNQVAPLQRAANAVNAAANATERALNTGTNVAANAAANTAAANTAAAANARFGYTNPNVATTPQGWFYDYYTYSPTYYSPPAANATVYGNAARYYDLNNDGVYDSLSTFRDSDRNGAYDVFDRFDFAENNNDKNNDGIADGPNDANRHTVTGTVEATKVAKVNNANNLVVRVTNTADQSADKSIIVDLGPAERWQSQAIKEGDQITATGPVEQIGEKRVLIAESVTVGKQQAVQIARLGPSIEGQIVDVTRAEVKGAEHTLAVVATQSDRQIVDLGPTDRLKFKVEPQTKITVQGVPVQFRNHSVVMADRINVNGQDVVIQRW